MVADGRWLITDLVTLGSPLTHAEFLLAKNADELKKRIAHIYHGGWAAGLLIDDHRPQLMCFPFGYSRQWQLHFACRTPW